MLDNKEKETAMEVSYEKLWAVMIGKDLKKRDLQTKAGINWPSVTKLFKGETASVEVLLKECRTLNWDIVDIMELILSEEDAAEWRVMLCLQESRS